MRQSDRLLDGPENMGVSGMFSYVCLDCFEMSFVLDSICSLQVLLVPCSGFKTSPGTSL